MDSLSTKSSIEQGFTDLVVRVGFSSHQNINKAEVYRFGGQRWITFIALSFCWSCCFGIRNRRSSNDLSTVAVARCDAFVLSCCIPCPTTAAIKSLSIKSFARRPLCGEPEFSTASLLDARALLMVAVCDFTADDDPMSFNVWCTSKESHHSNGTYRLSNIR